MASDPAERFERAMGRLFPANRSSGSCVVTTPPAREGDAGRPWREESSGARPQCRPWDRGDVLRRLATFKSMTWFGKPQAAGPVACARRGWTNVDADLLACEGCGAFLSFVLPPAASRVQAESAAEAFAERLDSGHKALCPWKGNACSDALSLFPPSPPAALLQGFHDRCEKLARLGALPAISCGVVDAFKLSCGSQVENLLDRASEGFQGAPERQEGAGAESGNAYGNDDFQRAQKVIALCGWEPRLLPYAVDSMEGASPPSKVWQTGDACNAVVSEKTRDPGPSVLMIAKADGREEKVETGAKAERDCDPASAVLDCRLCRASVGLWGFSAIPRPPPTLAAAAHPPQGSADALTAGVSAASAALCGGLAGGGPAKEGAAAATVVPGRSTRAPAPGVLNLNLTIAGGPPPTQLSSPGLIGPAFGPIPGFLPRLGQPEGSEVGDFVASRESRGSRDYDPGAEGLHERVVPAGSTAAGGTVVDVDECDDGKRAGSLKCRPSTDTSAVDQSSPGAAKVDAQGGGPQRKRRNTESNAGAGLHLARHGARDILPCSSSVNAVDTHYLQRQENSVESVENRFQDSEGLETVVSAENDVEDRAEGTGTGRLVGRRSRRSVRRGEELGLRKMDEAEFADYGRGDTNVAVISTGTGTAGETSVGMGMGMGMGVGGGGGGSAGTQASHEIEMQDANGADFSVHRPGTIPGDTEPVPEVTECQNTFGDRGLTGEFIPATDEEKAGDVRGDSYEYMLAQRPQGKSSVDAESGKKKGKRVYDEMDDQTVDTTKAVIVSGDNGHDKDATDEHTVVGGEEGDHGCTTVNGPRRVFDEFRSWDSETGKFDPLRQHRHFCPWVNGRVAAAATSGSGSQAGACGWQLTLDAVQGQYEQGASNGPHVANKSESTASVYNATSLVPGRRLNGSSPLQIFGKRPLL